MASGRTRQQQPPPYSRANGRESSARNLVDTVAAVPHSVDAEQASLGSALISGAATAYVLEFLSRDDFYLEAHRKVYDILEALAARDVVPDLVTVAEELRARGQVDIVGGMVYLSQLTESVPTATHVSHYASIVKKLAIRRRLKDHGAAVVASAESDDTDLLEVLEQVSHDVEQIKKNLPRKRKEPTSLKDLMQQDLPPILYLVDKMLPQGLIMLHADPKTGKTRMMDGLAMAVATGGMFLGRYPVQQQGRAVCIYLEDTPQDTQERMRVLLESEPVPDTLDLFWDWERLDVGGYADLDVYLTEHPDTKLVVIDTLEWVRPVRKTDDIYSEDVKALRLFKDLADKHGLCLIVLHHSNKGQNDDVIRSAGGTQGVAGSCDTVWRLQVHGDQDSNQATLAGLGRKIPRFKLLCEYHERAGWQSLGDLQQVQRTQELEEVLDLLAGGPMRPQDLAQELNIPRKTAHQRLTRYLKAGWLTKQAGGFYSPNSSATFPSSTPPVVDGVDAVDVKTCRPCGRSGGNTLSNPSNGIPPSPRPQSTPSTASTASTASTPPYVDAVDPPDEPPPVLELDPDTDVPELRRRCYGLAWARRWPPISLSDREKVEPTAKDWGHVTSGWREDLVEKLYDALNRMNGSS
jgi:hypothetical protein